MSWQNDPELERKVRQKLAELPSWARTDMRQFVCADPDCGATMSVRRDEIQRNGFPICCGMTAMETDKNPLDEYRESFK